MLFIPLEKIDIKQRLVYGTIAAEEADGANEILDYVSAKQAFQKWSDKAVKLSGGKSYGNVRSMHNRTAAGKVAQPLHFDDELKKISACVYVADDAEWAKVQEGVFTGFSPGGGYAKMWQDASNPRLKRYTPVVIELSLVDVPCQPSAGFSCIKADGTTEMMKFKYAEEPGDLDQGFRAKDGRFFKVKVAAEKWNKYLAESDKAREEAEATVTHPALEALAKAEKAADALEASDQDDEDEDEDAKAAAAKKAAKKPRLKKSEDLAKGFFNVARLAEIISELHWLSSDVECEEECEGDESPQPAALKAAVTSLITIITEMVAEEGEELGEKMAADKCVDLPRATADQLIKLIGTEHPIMQKIKVIEPEAIVPPSDELMKLNQVLETVTGDLAKERQVTNELAEGMTRMTKRLEAIERQPMPPRGPLRAVDRHNERIPTLEHQTKATTGTDTLQMPAGLSPIDQRAWKANQQRLIDQRNRH
jgi:hypothetical protein